MLKVNLAGQTSFIFKLKKHRMLASPSSNCVFSFSYSLTQDLGIIRVIKSPSLTNLYQIIQISFSALCEFQQSDE